jgi:hypothetical protein
MKKAPLDPDTDDAPDALDPFPPPAIHSGTPGAGDLIDSAGGASSGNALAEAQINRLDQLITQMARSNSTNEEILQATRQ